METKSADAPNTAKLETLAQSAKENSTGAGFMDPTQNHQPKKKVGRPSNAEKAEKAKTQKARAVGSGPNPQNPQGNPQAPPEIQALSQIPSKEIAKPLVSLVSAGAVAWVQHPKAAMSPEELEGGAQALGLLLDKYMPTMVTKYGIEIMCVMVFGQYGLRVFALKKVMDLEKAEMAKRMQAQNEPQRKTGEEKENNVRQVFPQDKFEN